LPINTKRPINEILRRINREIPDIDLQVGNSDSQTVLMIKIIVEETMKEIINNGNVIIPPLAVTTALSAGSTVPGKGDII